MHAASRTKLVRFDSLGAHVIGTKVTFPRNASGSYLSTTRLPARTVREKRKLNEVFAVDLLKQLDHRFPPRPIETRSNVCLTTVSGSESKTDTLLARMVEPASSPPLNQVLGKIKFKSSKGSKSGVIATAALTPGILKHGRAICTNPLHVTLGHAHDEILRQTAKQHGFRLTG